MKTLWVLPFLLLGCSSTTIVVKPCASLQRTNPYSEEETLKDNPYPEEPPTCEEACLASYSGCFKECLMGGGSEDTCLTECVHTDDCISQC